MARQKKNIQGTMSRRSTSMASTLHNYMYKVVNDSKTGYTSPGINGFQGNIHNNLYTY